MGLLVGNIKVTYDLTHQKPHVADNDVPSNESGIIQPMSTPFSQREVYPQHGKLRSADMYEGKVSQPLSDIKDGSFAIKRDKIQELFQKMVEEGVLLLKNRRDVTANMNNHLKYCLFHHLIGHELEDCHGFKRWLHKVLKSGAKNLYEVYVKMSGICYVLIKERHNNGCIHQVEEKEPLIINNVQRLLEQARGTRDKRKEKVTDINEDIVQP